MSVTLARYYSIALVLLALATGPMSAGEPKPTDTFAIYAGFETLSAAFFSHLLPKNDIDAKHGFCVLTDIEAFFLLDRKGQKATANWPPKRNAASFGKTIRVTYQTDPPTDCSVLVCPSLADDGKSIQFSIEAPKGSAFTLKGKVDVRLADTNVVYVPSQTLLDNGRRRLYLVLSPAATGRVVPVAIGATENGM